MAKLTAYVYQHNCVYSTQNLCLLNTNSAFIEHNICVYFHCLYANTVFNGASVWIAPLEMDSPGARVENGAGVDAACKGPLKGPLKAVTRPLWATVVVM